MSKAKALEGAFLQTQKYVAQAAARAGDEAVDRDVVKFRVMPGLVPASTNSDRGKDVDGRD